MIKAVPVEKALGMALAYDTTIVNREKAGVLLERGHVVSHDDIELLKNSGLYVIYVLDEPDNDAFESEISERIAITSSDLNSIEIKMGKQGSALLFSKFPGIIYVDVKALKKINLSNIALLITRRSYEAVGSSELIGVVDSLPLKIDSKKLDQIAGKLPKAIAVLPFKRKKIGLVITGTEIYNGRKKDLYTDVIIEKAKKYGWNIVFRKLVPDDKDFIANAIREAKSANLEAIIVTGGMSVDPTDVTPSAIRSLGAKIISYGIPVKPTTMSLAAYWEGIPIFGISAGGIYYHELNSIDVVFTLMMADIELTREMIARLGNGGLLPNFNPAFKLQ